MGRPRGRGRGRAAAKGGTGRGRGRPRTKKMVIDSDEEHEQMEASDIEEKPVETVEEAVETSTVEEKETVEEPTTIEPITKESSSVEFNIDDDISQLVPPTFSTISKGPPQPMLELTWDHQYAPMGEKVASPNIHMCICCKLPIRLYGRLIPCKHVFCHACAVKQGDRCSCCEDRVSRIEKAPLGSVFMCLHGGIQYGYEGCRRTYLSKRDLEAHFNHRHKPRPSSGGSNIPMGSNSSSSSSILNSSINDVQSPVQSSASSTPSNHRQNIIPVHYSSGRSNLISVPLQSGPPPGNRNLNKDPHDPRYDPRKPGSSSSYSRNNPSSGWGSFRPY